MIYNTKPAQTKIDPILSRHLKQFGAKGGIKRTANMNKTQLSKAASNAVNVRWLKHPRGK